MARDAHQAVAGQLLRRWKAERRRDRGRRRGLAERAGDGGQSHAPGERPAMRGGGELQRRPQPPAGMLEETLAAERRAGQGLQVIQVVTHLPPRWVDGQSLRAARSPPEGPPAARGFSGPPDAYPGPVARFAAGRKPGGGAAQPAEDRRAVLRS